MRKFIVISIVLLMLAGFAITSSAQDLVVGRQHVPVGTLTVAVVGDNLVITYDITDSEWELLGTHLYVGITPPTKSAPGRFPYGPEDVSEEGKYVIALGVFTGTLYIAAHAEIGMIDGDGNPVLDEYEEQIKETTWAYGENQIPPGKNWAMYFTFPLPE